VASSVFIVANDPSRFDDLDLPVYTDLLPGAGALGGIYTAVVQAPVDRVIAVACDMPFLDAGLLERLTELAAEGDGAWVRTARGAEPLLACYRRSAAPAIRRELNAGRLRAGDLGGVLKMAELAEADVARYGTLDQLLLNLNSPEDYARVGPSDPDTTG